MVRSNDLQSVSGSHPHRERIGRQVHVVESCDSTNDLARAWGAKHRRDEIDGVTFLTSDQRGGRGTRGRTWWSPPGTSIALSLILQPNVSGSPPAALTLLGAVAVAKGGEAFGADVAIKWPNDVVDRTGNKLCGILGEGLADHDGTFVLGIGVNVLPPVATPPAGLPPIGTLADAGATDVNLSRFATRLLDEFDALYTHYQRDGIDEVLGEFHARSWLATRAVRLRRGTEIRRARLIEMSASLDLHLEDDDGIRFTWPGEQTERVIDPS